MQKRGQKVIALHYNLSVGFDFREGTFTIEPLRLMLKRKDEEMGNSSWSNTCTNFSSLLTSEERDFNILLFGVFRFTVTLLYYFLIYLHSGSRQQLFSGFKICPKVMHINDNTSFCQKRQENKLPTWSHWLNRLATNFSNKIKNKKHTYCN